MLAKQTTKFVGSNTCPLSPITDTELGLKSLQLVND
jgi:hypothetical protein